VSFKPRESLIHVRGKLLDLEVGLDAAGRDALGKHDVAALDAPGIEELAFVQTRSGAEFGHERIVDGAGLPGLIVSKWGVGDDLDAFAPTKVEKFSLLEVRVDFDLVDGRDYLGLGEEVFQTALVEIGYTDGLDFACG